MTHARPSEPDPRDRPGQPDQPGPAGSPDDPRVPDHAGTERVSESETLKQSPTPQPGRKGAYVWIVAIVVVVLFVVIGLAGYAFEVF